MPAPITATSTLFGSVGAFGGSFWCFSQCGLVADGRGGMVPTAAVERGRTQRDIFAEEQGNMSLKLPPGFKVDPLVLMRMIYYKTLISCI